MNLPILVTGGTGTLGRHVVKRLREKGEAVRVLSRRAQQPLNGVDFRKGDLKKSVDLAETLAGAQTVIHCAGSRSGDAVATRNLVMAAREAGVGHLVYISVIGAGQVPQLSAADRMMFSYFAQKAEAELSVMGSGIPFTILRSAQFHDLLFATIGAMTKLPIVPIPSGFRFQPIDAREVAGRLVNFAVSSPAGRAADMAGPEIYSMEELVRSHLQRFRKKRLLLPVKMRGRAAEAFRNGVNLAPDHRSGTIRWESFLAARA